MAKAKLSSTARGLGQRHRRAVEDLLAAHADGSPCPWCGRPRWLNRTRNYDYDAASTNPASGKLQGDHSGMSRSEALQRGLPIRPPDRLLHARCNRERGDGANDHLARGAAPSATAGLAIPWPW